VRHLLEYGNAVLCGRENGRQNPNLPALYSGHLDSSRVSALINWIAANPEAGDVIKGSGGCWKVRWSASGRGRRGGVRVIYFNVSEHTIWLLIVYTKGKFDNLPTSFLAELKQGVEDAR
jgi:mRNA-degrading endonuclease RelE of RelBE toxin-antitoxin system